MTAKKDKKSTKTYSDSKFAFSLPIPNFSRWYSSQTTREENDSSRENSIFFNSIKWSHYGGIFSNFVQKLEGHFSLKISTA